MCACLCVCGCLDICKGMCIFVCTGFGSCFIIMSLFLYLVCASLSVLRMFCARICTFMCICIFHVCVCERNVSLFMFVCMFIHKYVLLGVEISGSHKQCNRVCVYV